MPSTTWLIVMGAILGVGVGLGIVWLLDMCDGNRTRRESGKPRPPRPQPPTRGPRLPVTDPDDNDDDGEGGVPTRTLIPVGQPGFERRFVGAVDSGSNGFNANLPPNETGRITAVVFGNVYAKQALPEQRLAVAVPCEYDRVAPDAKCQTVTASDAAPIGRDNAATTMRIDVDSGVRRGGLAIVLVGVSPALDDGFDLTAGIWASDMWVEWERTHS